MSRQYRVAIALLLTALAVGPFSLAVIYFVKGISAMFNDMAPDASASIQSNRFVEFGMWMSHNSVWALTLLWLAFIATFYVLLSTARPRAAYYLVSFALLLTIGYVIVSMYMPVFNVVNVIQ